MVRKRLSDMLREEAQKPVETESAPTPTAQGDDTSNTTQSKPASKRRNTTTGSQTAASPPSSASKDTVSKEEGTAIAVEVISLKAELETAIKQVTDLNQQVADLKAELGNQTTASQKLQTTLEKAEQRKQQLETELNEAKQTVLQLVEVNTQLKQDLTAKQAMAARETVSQKITAPPKKSLPEPSPIVPAEPKKSTLAASTHHEFLQRQQKSLAHPVFPAGNSPGHLSDQDLGWVD